MKQLYKFIIIALFIIIGLRFTSNDYLTTHAISQQEMVDCDLELITVPEKAILSFPVVVKSVYNNTISWSSSNKEVLEFIDGWFVVNRSLYEDFNVTVTVNITSNNTYINSSKEFYVFIPSGKTNTSIYSINYYNIDEIEVENFKKSYSLGDKTIVLEDINRDNYLFDGWYLDEGYNQRIEKILVGSNSDYHLYAKWNPITYTVTFYDDNQVDILSTVEVEHGKVLSTFIPEKEGYEFKSWYYNDELFDINTIITSKIDLVARWESLYDELPMDINFVNTLNNPVEGWTYQALGPAVRDGGLNFYNNGSTLYSPQYNFNTDVILTLSVQVFETAGAGNTIYFIALDEENNEIKIVALNNNSNGIKDLTVELPSSTKKIKITFLKSNGKVHVYSLRIDEKK